MLKDLLFLSGIAIALGACTSSAEESTEVESTGYSITASFDTLNYDSAHLAYYEGGKFVRENSVAISEGTFKMEGEVSSPKMYSIIFGEGNDNRIYLFLENSEVSINGKSISDEGITVTGSGAHDDYLTFSEKDGGFNDQIKALYGLYDAAEEGDQDYLDSLDGVYSEIDSLRAQFVEDYISEKNTSAVAAYALYINSYRFELEELEKHYGQFSEDVKISEYGVIINDKIVALTNTQIGKLAPLFAMNDADGNSINIESYKGKYLLIDFWASWCGPCRAENPNVVKAYAEFHDQGLEILGVSLDSDKDKWLAAIEKDGLTWDQVSDLNGWDCEPVKTYAVSSIPHSVLLDPNGIIVAKNLRAEELQAKLAELLTNS